MGLYCSTFSPGHLTVMEESCGGIGSDKRHRVTQVCLFYIRFVTYKPLLIPAIVNSTNSIDVALLSHLGPLMHRGLYIAFPLAVGRWYWFVSLFTIHPFRNYDKSCLSNQLPVVDSSIWRNWFTQGIIFTVSLTGWLTGRSVLMAIQLGKEV
jgi:hypothetical protein